MSEFSSKDYANGYRDGAQSAEATITALRAENERLSTYAKRAAMDVLLCKDGNILLHEENERLKEWNREIALNAREFAAENEKLRAYALKAFTIVDFCSGEGFLLEYPSYDCDDLLMEGVELLKVETSEEARAALGEKQ